MADPMERLEAELTSLRPVSLSSQLVDAISDAIGDDLADPPMRLADRCLLAAMGAGSLAACVIVGVLTLQLAGSTARPPQPILAAQPTPAAPATIGQYQQALARADGVHEVFR